MEITRGKILGAQKCAIYGPEGIGKSYFASKFPNPVFIDTEGSTKHMDVARTSRPTSWTMLLEQVKYYKTNPTEYDTLIIDTADWAEKLCAIDVCATRNKKGIADFGYGNGFNYLAEEFGRLLNLLEELIELGINVVIVAHAQLRKFEQPDEMGSYDRWEMKLEKKVYPLVKEWADMVLFANYKTYVINVDNQGAEKGKNKVQGGKRVMFTNHHPCWDAKNRHDLKDELPLDYDEIAHCIIARDGSITIEPPNQPPSNLVEPPKNIEQEFNEMVSEVPPKKEIVPADWSDLARKPDHIPKALADLMKPEKVTVAEIQKAVASKGYYPEDTPLEKYDSNFINGVLIGAWPQVFGMIKEIREEPY
jgi:hypothetical protein